MIQGEAGAPARTGTKVGRISLLMNLNAPFSARLKAFLAACLLSPFGFAAEREHIDPASMHGRTALDLTEQLAHSHLRGAALDDDTSSVMLDRYLDALDPARVFFLDADIEAFEDYRYKLDDFIEDEDVSPPFEIFNRLLDRQADRFAWLIERIENEWDAIDFTTHETLLIDRSEVPWATDTEALDSVWNKRLKASIIEGKLAGETDEEIQGRLLKRYRNSLANLTRYNAQDVFSVFVNAYASWLDPHTAYLSPPAFENFSINMSQSLEGIGAVLSEEDDYVRIQRVLPGSPASKSGRLVPDTKILAVGQGRDGVFIDVVGWRIDDVVKLIRGPRDSIVRLRVRAPQFETQSEPLEVSIVRNRIELEEQAAESQLIEFEHAGRTRRMGVIEVSSFYADYEHNRTSSGDVERLVAELDDQGVEGIVIDLRNNGGGLLQEANSLAGLFIDEGPIVQVRQQRRRPYTHHDRNQGLIWDGPLAVLVNRLSASASEIFAAAIQDYGRGIVVGERTFGKGTIQEIVPLDYGQIKLTQGKFYRISGMSTQHDGVTPDIDFPQSFDPEEVGESARETALPSDSIARAKYARSRQVEALTPILRDNHESRSDKDPDFLYVEDMAALASELKDRTHLNLHLETRMSEKAALDERRLDIENRLRIAKGEEVLASLDELYETPAESEPTDDFTGDAPDDTDSVAALNEAQQAPEAQDEQENDPFVVEAMRILADFEALSSQLLAATEEGLASPQ